MCFSVKRKEREETADILQPMGLFHKIHLSENFQQKKLGHFSPCGEKKIAIFLIYTSMDTSSLNYKYIIL